MQFLRKRKLPFFGQQPVSFYPFTPFTSLGVMSVGDAENEVLARQLGEEISNVREGKKGIPMTGQI